VSDPVKKVVSETANRSLLMIVRRPVTPTTRGGGGGRPGKPDAANKATVCGSLQPPQSPKNANLANNIAQAEAKSVNGFLKQTTGLADLHLAWWINNVRPNGAWDYKNPQIGGPAYDAFGNLNYGATGLALGLDPVTVLRGAGWAQEFSSMRPQPEWGSPGSPLNPAGGTGPYFGDDPGGNYWVVQGMLYYTFCSKKG
jgi:Bacterial toxin 44